MRVRNKNVATRKGKKKKTKKTSVSQLQKQKKKENTVQCREMEVPRGMPPQESNVQRPEELLLSFFLLKCREREEKRRRKNRRVRYGTELTLLQHHSASRGRLAYPLDARGRPRNSSCLPRLTLAWGAWTNLRLRSRLRLHPPCLLYLKASASPSSRFCFFCRHSLSLLLESNGCLHSDLLTLIIEITKVETN